LRHDEEHIGVAQRWYRFEGSIGHRRSYLACTFKVLQRLVVRKYNFSQAPAYIY